MKTGKRSAQQATLSAGDEKINILLAEHFPIRFVTQLDIRGLWGWSENRIDFAQLESDKNKFQLFIKGFINYRLLF